jgi:hypothetical protein
MSKMYEAKIIDQHGTAGETFEFHADDFSLAVDHANHMQGDPEMLRTSCPEGKGDLTLFWRRQGCSNWRKAQ